MDQRIITLFTANGSRILSKGWHSSYGKWYQIRLNNHNICRGGFFCQICYPQTIYLNPPSLTTPINFIKGNQPDLISEGEDAIALWNLGDKHGAKCTHLLLFWLRYFCSLFLNQMSLVAIALYGIFSMNFNWGLMPRPPRDLKPGYCYHVTIRCNN